MDIQIDPAYLRAWTDLNPDWRPGEPITPGRDYQPYWAMHEIGHGLGMIDGYGHYDRLVSAGSDGLSYFTGLNAVAAYGGPVPLTDDDHGAHLGNGPADGLTNDVMSGRPNGREFVYQISAVDAAIAMDLGFHPATGIPALYTATFSRAPDAAGLAYWQQRFDAGMTLPQIAQSFFDQPEAQAVLGGDIVSAVYHNALGRAPDPAGYAYWSGELESGRVQEGEFVLAIINGAQGEDAVHLLGIALEA
jgi:hypothetical protein